MPRRSLASMLLAALVLATIAAPAAAGLREQIDLVVRAGELAGATVAVSVREAGPGNEIVSIDGRRMMIPASNLKLLSTGAALHTLGPEFRFETRLLRRGDDIVVEGDGDPAFGDPMLLREMTTAGGDALSLDDFVDLWVQAIVRSGMTEVNEIIVDDRVFDREYVHETWPRDQLNRSYCAQVSGLVFHLNQVYFYPQPRRGQRPDLLNFDPHFRSLNVTNNATSHGGPNHNDTVWIARRLGTNDLTFYANVKHPYRTPVPVTVHESAVLYGELLADRLRAAGIEVGGSRLIGPEEEHALDADGVLGPTVFTPIATAVTRCNRDSQNLYAECLVKRMGHAMTGQPGSWLNGAAIVRHVVHERVGDADLAARMRMVDGSGLSRDNRIAPSTLTAWLNSFHNDEALGQVYIESLSIGGVNGTLRKRLRADDLDGAVVNAKSGRINGVSCLSGYVTNASGRRRCFSVMINDLRSPVHRAKALQEKIVRAIVEDMADSPVSLGSD